MNEAINDNRYELIKKYKQKLIEATNIESREDEMEVIDNILFRFWQIGWLDKLEEIPSAGRPNEDGTLEVKVEDATKVGRVLISDDKHRGGLYYPDEDEPKGDLISRAEAIEAMGEEPPVWCDEDYEIAERDQWRADIEAIKSVPSAERPRGRWHYSDGKPATIGQSFGVICDQCGAESEYCTNFCPNCGADMRGEDE